MTTMKRLRGLRALVQDVVEHGSSAIERVHLATARRPFAVLESIPGVAPPARLVHAVHDVSVAGVYATIRLVNRAVGASVELALDAVERRDANAAAAPGPAGDASEAADVRGSE